MLFPLHTYSLYNKTTHGDTCCGKVAYDSSDRSEICCMGTSLFHNANGASCCQSNIIDTFKDTCRSVGDERYVFPRRSNWVDCSEGSYDPARQTCCQGLLYNFPGECCGKEIIKEGEDQICCDSRKQDSDFGEKSLCCGGEVRNAEIYTCCGNASLPKTHRWETCCDGVITDKWDCHKKGEAAPRPPSNLEPAMCGGQLFNASQHGCCNGVLYDPELNACTNKSLQPLCAGTPYDDAIQMCCAGETYDPLTTGCCNGTPYELSSRHTCCDNVLHRMKNGACCGAAVPTPYNSNRYLCCNGTLQRKKKSRTECCGDRAIDPKTDTCCQGEVTRGTSNGTCCGNKAFDPTEKMCCPETGKLYHRRPSIQRIFSDNASACCAPGQEYNTTAGTCVPQGISLYIHLLT